MQANQPDDVMVKAKSSSFLPPIFKIGTELNSSGKSQKSHPNTDNQKVENTNILNLAYRNPKFKYEINDEDEEQDEGGKRYV